MVGARNARVFDLLNACNSLVEDARVARPHRIGDEVRRGRLEAVARDASVDEQVDLERIEACAPEGLLARRRGELARLHLRRGPAARPHSRHVLEPARLQAEALSEPGALLDLGRGDDVGGKLGADAGDAYGAHGFHA